MSLEGMNYDLTNRPPGHLQQAPNFWSPPTPSQESTFTDTTTGSEFSEDTVRPRDPVSRAPPAVHFDASPASIPVLRLPPAPAPSPPETRPRLARISIPRLFDSPVQSGSGAYYVPRAFLNHPFGTFDNFQPQMGSLPLGNRALRIREELDLSITPGVDDTPFIKNALEMMTREDGVPLSPSLSSSNDSGESPIPLLMRDQEPEYTPILDLPEVVHKHSTASSTQPSDRPAHVTQRANNPLNPPVFVGNSATPPTPSPAPLARAGPGLDGKTKWAPVPDTAIEHYDPKRIRCPRQNAMPFVLRLPSSIILVLLCIGMVALLMASAIYSKKHAGLLSYTGTMYSGQYFLFRLLPQILSGAILVYAQMMMMATFRILPFASMAQEDPGVRAGAIFQDLYPTAFLWPHLVGPWQMRLYILVTWFMNFTIPLQSSLFAVIYVDGDWRWAAVQGVAWTLVALHILFVSALAMHATYWFGRQTGLLWDVRSIADFVPMVNHSNVIELYDGTQRAASRPQLKAMLQGRLLDRLGYWRFENTSAEPYDGPKVWWGMGSQDSHLRLGGDRALQIARETNKRAKPLVAEKLGASDLGLPAEAPEIRYRYLPWCLRNAQVACFVVGGVLLMIVLLCVSFIQRTRLSHGFRPGLEARPDAGAFSPANFLFSFIPSLVGQVLFLLFQSLDLSLRKLQPWAELSRDEGSLAATSILVDYAACYPLQASVRALRNGHFRVAFVSFLSVLFIFLPILGGGLFMALTLRTTGEVRMFPSIPVFGIALTLLWMFLAGLIVLVPDRKRFRLPHGVDCIAEILSFLCVEELYDDAAFRFPKSKFDMCGRLGMDRDVREQSRWAFGLSPGRDETLAVRRLKRYTEKNYSRRPLSRKFMRGHAGVAKELV